MLIHDVMGFKSAQEGMEVCLVRQFYAHEGRTEVLVGLLDVLEIYHVVSRTDDVADEGKHDAGLLREVDYEIMLQTFVKQRLFLDLFHPGDVVVAAADYACHLLAFDLFLILAEGCYGKPRG